MELIASLVVGGFLVLVWEESMELLARWRASL